MRGADFPEIQRKDVWSISLSVLREVVINALVHTDYSQRGASIRIAFFDDRIEVENPGIPLPGMTIEDMKSGVSKIRNPAIARVFRELKLIEQWSSGVRNILRQSREMGLPEPLVQEIGMRLRFTIFLAEPQVLDKQQVGSRAARSESGAQSKAQSETVLPALSDTPLSAAELMHLLGLETKTGAFKRTIKELLQQALIEYIYPR
jgi:ATP-dependent DNA helicase RecG